MKVLKVCEWLLLGQAQCCWPCKASKLKCTVGGVPQSIKRAWMVGPKDTGPSQSAQGDPLFLEMELEDGVEGWAESVESEAPRGQPS